MDRVHPHPAPLLLLGLLIQLLHVVLEGLGDHPCVGVPDQVVEDRPHRRPVLHRQLRHPPALPELLHVVEVQGLRDVLRDVVDRSGVALDPHVLLGEGVDVDEPDIPDRTRRVPVAEVLEPGQDGARVGIRRIRTERPALPVVLDLQRPVQMEDDVDRWIAGDGGLLDDDLGVAVGQRLLQTGEEVGNPPASGRYVEVSLVTGHHLVIYREGQEEQMRVDAVRCLIGDARLSEDLVQPAPLDRLPEGVLGIAPAGHRAGGVLPGLEVREEVVVLRVDVLHQIREESIRIDLSGEDVLLELPAVSPVEDAHLRRLPEGLSDPAASRLPAAGINRIYAGIRHSLSPGKRVP